MSLWQSNDVGENILRKHSKKSSRLKFFKVHTASTNSVNTDDFPLDFASSTILAPVCITRFGCLEISYKLKAPLCDLLQKHCMDLLRTYWSRCKVDSDNLTSSYSVQLSRYISRMSTFWDVLESGVWNSYVRGQHLSMSIRIALSIQLGMKMQSATTQKVYTLLLSLGDIKIANNHFYLLFTFT